MKRSPLRPQSKKRRREASARARIRVEALERDGGCVLRAHPGHVCRGPLDAHEVVPRSRWVGGHLVLSNVQTLCRQAHTWVHDHPNEARALGLTATRGDQ